MHRLVARHLFDGQRLLSPGLLEWDASGHLTAVSRPSRGARVRDVFVVPGLVNAHAHLQLPDLGEKPPSFVAWIGAVMAARGRLDRRALEARTRGAVRELVASGCTAIGEIDSVGSSPSVLADSGVAGRCYQEVTGFDLDENGARARLRERWTARCGVVRPGLSPHAPYSVSRELFLAAGRRSRHLSVHAAELVEEQEFLRTGRGPLRDLLQRLGRLPPGWKPPGIGAIRWLERLGLLRAGTLLVHAQHLERGDAARIAARGATIVVCPGTIHYFGREAPPIADWLARGIAVALGTDSRASNTGLLRRAELRRAAGLLPGLAPLQLLAMATAHGGRALSMPGIGRLQRGGRADFAVAACGHAAAEAAVEAFVWDRSPLAWTCTRGRRTKGVRPGGGEV